jgi:hypothetical protein
MEENPHEGRDKRFCSACPSLFGLAEALRTKPRVRSTGCRQAFSIQLEEHRDQVESCGLNIKQELDASYDAACRRVRNPDFHFFVIIAAGGISHEG